MIRQKTLASAIISPSVGRILSSEDERRRARRPRKPVESGISRSAFNALKGHEFRRPFCDELSQVPLAELTIHRGRLVSVALLGGSFAKRRSMRGRIGSTLPKEQGIEQWQVI